jgi:hypothetical protein
MDDLVNFQETTVKEILTSDERFFNSKGQELEREFWMTMMNYMTDERLPERQFCLATTSLTQKIERKTQMSQEELRITAEINKSKFNIERLQKELEQISITEEISDEANTVNQEVIEINEVSDECVTVDGQPIKVIYVKRKGFYLKFKRV